MDHIKIIKRAFNITKVYRALWLFGILLALTAGGGGSSNATASFSPSGNQNFNFFEGTPFPWTWQEVTAVLVPIAISLICLALLVAVIFAIARYVTETAVIRMVDRHEETEEKVSVRAGFRLGWSRSAWRLFLIDLLIAVCTVAAIILVGLIAFAPLLLWTTGNNTLGVLGTVVAIGLSILFVFLGIAVAVVLSVLLQFFHRAAVLEDLGVVESIRRGFSIVRKHLADVVVMALILFGIGLGWFIVMIPVYILLGLVGILLAGGLGLGAGFLTGLAAEGALPWIVGFVVGLPLFLLVFGLPALFLNGLMKVFVSSSWTLTYRELLATENGTAQELALPEGPEPPGQPGAPEPPELPELPVSSELPEPPELPENPDMPEPPDLPMPPAEEF
jgi:hypothetical protein